MVFHSEQLKSFREQRGWTMRELAAKVGVNYSAICRWESGKNAPRLSQIKKLAKALGVTADELRSTEVSA